MITIEARKLKKENRCKKFREHEQLAADMSTAKETQDAYVKASVMKKYLKELLLGHMSMQDAATGLEKQFLEDLHYPTPETARAQAEEALRVIGRYVGCEERTPIPCMKMMVQPFGMLNVTVKPDYVFKGYRIFERYYINAKGKKEKYESYEPYIEIVNISCSKPNITANGKKKDGSAMASLEMYAMLQAAKQYVKPEDGNINIGASFYFLRKKTDSDYNDCFNPDFWETKGDGNVVTLWDKYTFGNTFMTDVDTLYLPQFQSFLHGEEDCDPEKCASCEFRKSCNFTKPPIQITKTAVQKTLGCISLTPAQESIVAFRDGCAVTNACAGSGKTTVTALNVAFMLDEGVPGDDIIVISFGETSVKEFRSRIGLYAADFGCSKQAENVCITTFHALGYSIIKKEYAQFGFAEEPVLIDNIKRARIIKDLLSKHVVEGLDYKNFSMNLGFVKGALPVIEKAFEVIKENRYVPGDEEALFKDLDGLKGGYTFGFVKEKTLPQLFDLYAEYDAILKKQCLIEYSDMEILMLDLLEQDPFYMEDHFHYRHIIIDEFQDTNEAQFQMMKALRDTRWFQSLLVVGDDSQSIFSFRGTSPEFIIKFGEKLGVKVETLDLLENHRSSGSIIRFANFVNSHINSRVDKDMVATRPMGEPVKVEAFWKGDKKDKYILELFQKKAAEGMAYEDMAYIAQSRSELMKIASLCTEAGIPTIMLNPETMIDNSRVSAALALCRFMADPSSTSDAFEYLNCKLKNEMLGAVTDEEIKKEIASLQSQREAIYILPDKAAVSALKEMLEALKDEDEIYDSFLNMLYQNGTYEEIIQYALDFYEYGEGQAKKRENDYPGIVLTTAHSSKGMEWKFVINDISKYVRDNLTMEQMDDALRLLFVSATRARDELCIVSSVVAYGKKATRKDERDTRVINPLLTLSMQYAGKEIPAEPTKEKKA